MKEKTILTFIDRCKDVVKTKMTRNAYAITHNLSAAYFYSTWNNILSNYNDGNLDVELFNKAAEALTSLDASYAIYTKDGVKFDEEGNDNYTEIERDEAGKIISYKFKISKKNRRPIIGKFTRDEMELVYRLYTNYGQGLTKKAIVKYFPEYSLEDFKRILNAWNIYKDSSPLPLHIIEEHTEEELLALQARNKEVDFVKKLDKIELQSIKNILNKVQLENSELKKQLNDRTEILKELNINNTFGYYEDINYDLVDHVKTGIIVISDLHVGAFNCKYGYVPLEDYNEDEIRRRLHKIVEFATDSDWNSVIIVNLGDGIDSYKKETTRGGHQLPTNMNDKDMSILYQKLMMEFFNSLHESYEDIRYYCVGESNHPGDWGWLNDVLLAEKLKALNITSYISNTPILNFNINEVTFTCLHGKNNVSQYKGFPLTLNDKTTNWFNNYFLDTDFDFKKKKYVIKGDLHQYAVTKAQSFDYISMPSIYGSSEYIVANFGKTRWACGYLVVDNNNVCSGVIED